MASASNSERTITSNGKTYSLLSVIGEGAFGTIYEAKLAQSDCSRRYAIKTLTKNGTKRLLESEVHGISLMMQLDSGNIVKILDMSHNVNNIFCIMERLDVDLNVFARNFADYQFSIDHTIQIAQGLLRALQALKERRILHLDMRPENIMVVNQRRDPLVVKIIDFGMASKYPFTKFQRKIIQLPMYRAPEIYLLLKISEAVDMWSLGVTLCQLLLGRDPFGNNARHEYDKSSKEEELEILSDMTLWAEQFPQEMIRQSPKKNYYFRMKPNSMEYRLPVDPPTAGIGVLLSDCDPHPKVLYLLDLIDSMLRVDPINRITPETALDSEVFR